MKKLIVKVKQWWQTSRERMVAHYVVRYDIERREHLASRQQIQALERDLEAAQLAIVSCQPDPLKEAKRLLRIAEDVMTKTTLNRYEMRCWLDEYRQFKLDHLR